MGDIVISVENLSKIYNLGQIGTGTISNDLKVWWAKKRGKPNPLLKIGQTDHGNQDGEILLALKDINFTVQQGEVLGIIGRNGAGKSTLLKILSRVTAPTSGQIKVKGRIASLLEVGTGFHPELTGRENIFLNGAILGMSRQEILRKFDEIITFAEVEKFIDTPVKRYSSGMYVRLAFAVAAHLESEILLVDEVLAVGDAEFQKKCLGKMGSVAKEGRTVLFVSHNMQAITRICPETILLIKGKLILKDNSTNAVNHYMNNEGLISSQTWKDIDSAPGDQSVKLISIKALNQNYEPQNEFDIRKPINLQLEYNVLESGIALRPWIALFNDLGICVFAVTDTDISWTKKNRKSGKYLSEVTIPGNLLSEGGLSINVGMSSGTSVGDYFIVDGAIGFQITDPNKGDSARGHYGGSFPGVVRPKLDWHTRELDV
jgi:lipopolysaccharide transport system ATP-binding protein